MRNDNFNALFTTHSLGGSKKNIKKFYPRDIQRLLKKSIGKAGIIKEVTPRMVRDTFIARELLKGEYMKDVALKMGRRGSRFWGNLNVKKELEGYITYKEASKKYGYSEHRIARLCNKQNIPFIRFKKKIYLKNDQDYIKIKK